MPKVLMFTVQILLLLTVALLAGCGEVIVFGHTVREAHPASESKSGSAPAPAAATTSSATSTSVAPAANAAATATAIPIIKVKAVTISIAPQAADKIAADSRFSSDALLDAIKRELQSRKLFDVNDLPSSSSVKISIDDYALHPKTNFALFGYIPNTGTLDGNLVLHDEHDVSSSRHVEAQTSVSVPVSGEVDNMLQPLYHEFAVMVVDTLTGTQTKSSVERDQPPR